jgi:hypothetical protein
MKPAIAEHVTDAAWSNLNARCRRWMGVTKVYGDQEAFGRLAHLRWLYRHGLRSQSLHDQMVEICDRLNSESRRKA